MFAIVRIERKRSCHNGFFTVKLDIEKGLELMRNRLSILVALLVVTGLTVNANADVILVADTATGNVNMHVGATGDIGCGTTVLCTSGQQDNRLFGVSDGSVPNGYSPPSGGITGLAGVTINDAFGDGQAVAAGVAAPGIFALLTCSGSACNAGTVFQDGSSGTYEEARALTTSAAEIADGTIIPLGAIFNTAIDPNADFDRYRLQAILVADGFPSSAPLFAGVFHTAVIP